MRRRPAIIKPGMWLRWRPDSVFEECALVVSVNADSVEVHREHQVETEWISLGFVRFHWQVMRPTAHRNEREAVLIRAGKPAMPEWVAAGERFCRLFDNVTVYEIVEVRGMWMLAKDVVSGALLFSRASELTRFCPIQTRFQRVQ